MSDEQPEPIKVTVTANGMAVYGEVGGYVDTTRPGPVDRPMFSSTGDEAPTVKPMTPVNIAHLRRELKRMRQEWLAEADRAEKNERHSELCTLCKCIDEIRVLYEHLFGVSIREPIEEPKSSQDLSDQKIEALYKRVFGEPTKEDV